MLVEIKITFPDLLKISNSEFSKFLKSNFQDIEKLNIIGDIQKPGIKELIIFSERCTSKCLYQIVKGYSMPIKKNKVDQDTLNDQDTTQNDQSVKGIVEAKEKTKNVKASFGQMIEIIDKIIEDSESGIGQLVSLKTSIGDIEGRVTALELRCNTIENENAELRAIIFGTQADPENNIAAEKGLIERFEEESIKNSASVDQAINRIETANNDLVEHFINYITSYEKPQKE